IAKLLKVKFHAEEKVNREHWQELKEITKLTQCAYWLTGAKPNAYFQ
ncbi:MAG: hypothetical protein RL355_962, partial [Actinomycetota bacterium]